MKADECEVHYLMSSIEEKIHRWLVDLTYWYGWEQGYTASTGDKRKLNSKTPSGRGYFLFDWAPRPKDFKFYWYFSYGHIYLRVKESKNDRLSGFIIDGKQLDVILVINNNDLERLDAQSIVILSERVEKKIDQFFYGALKFNGLKICPLPTHYYNLPEYENELHIKPFPSTCRRIGGTWICETCIEQFGLEESYYTLLPLKKHQTEMKRLTPERKLATLTRDQYTCQNCGQSAMNNREIKLRVIHIVPIIEGGKSTPENLTTVCFECINDTKKPNN